MSDTIRYRNHTYGEADALALLQALADDGTRSVNLCAFRRDCWASLRGDHASTGEGPTPWAALVAAVKAAGLEDAAPTGGPADAAKR